MNVIQAAAIILLFFSIHAHMVDGGDGWLSPILFVSGAIMLLAGSSMEN